MHTITLSKREKVLLYILLCLALFVVGWYLLVEPMMKSNKALNAEYLTLQTQYDTNKRTMDAYGDLDAANEQVNSDITVNKGNFHESVTTEQVDKLFTTLVQKHGLVPVSLSLEEAKGEKLTAYTKEQEKTETTTEATTETKEDTEAIVKVMVVKQVFSTNKLATNTSDYIEAIKKMAGVHVTSLSYSSEQGGTNITMEYKIYMLK